MPDLDLTTDHKALDDDLAARRYFKKFDAIRSEEHTSELQSQ